LETIGHNRIAFALILAIGLTGVAAGAQNGVELSPPDQPAPQGTILDLAKFFHTRSAWRLVVTEGVPVKDYGDNEAPGALTLYLHKGLAGSCISGPVTPPLGVTISDNGPAWEPHYLITAKVVYPRGPKAAPFLEIITGSLNSGDGDQLVYTQLLKYDVERDVFRRIYGKGVGHNNNEEVRFITQGPLQGDVISAEPQNHLPYGYWIVVSRLTPMDTYHQVLRYRSATLYNDGNSLAVIDSEMPNIVRRLGLWKPGDPIPTPNHGKRCLKPILRHTELWCG
jgi:hypothetical protein